MKAGISCGTALFDVGVQSNGDRLAFNHRGSDHVAVRCRNDAGLSASRWRGLLDRDGNDEATGYDFSFHFSVLLSVGLGFGKKLWCALAEQPAKMPFADHVALSHRDKRVDHVGRSHCGRDLHLVRETVVALDAVNAAVSPHIELSFVADKAWQWDWIGEI